MLQKSLTPNLPEDLAISFYIQSHKLVFAVYQLSNIHGTMKFDTYQAEASVPWLNEVLVLFTVALQLCQQLKDKVRNILCLIFSCFKIFFLELLNAPFLYLFPFDICIKSFFYNMYLSSFIKFYLCLLIKFLEQLELCFFYFGTIFTVLN